MNEHDTEEILLDEEQLVDMLSHGGIVASALRGFVQREPQLRMLRSVIRGFNESLSVVVEAGTGVGKSFAYLIPAALWALQNKEPVVITTATINLQHQLVDRDIILVQQALNISLNVVLAKGKNNYVCLRRLQKEIDEPDLFGDHSALLLQIMDWIYSGKGGSRSDLPVQLSHEQWNSINSEHDLCAQHMCPNRERCCVWRARKQLWKADIIVVNHHLLLSDMLLRHQTDDAATILPAFSRVIFDEAHRLEETATEFFSQAVSSRGIQHHLSSLKKRRKTRKKSTGLLAGIQKHIRSQQGTAHLHSAEELIPRMHHMVQQLNLTVLSYIGSETSRIFHQQDVPAMLSVLQDMTQLMKELTDELFNVVRSLDEDQRELPEAYALESTARRLKEAVHILLQFFQKENTDNAGITAHHTVEENEENLVCWVERVDSKDRAESRLVITPVDMRSIINEVLLQPYKTTVFTSATLTVNGNFHFWSERTGIAVNADITMSLDSPFAYESRVLLAVPNDAPFPNTEEYITYLVRLVIDLVRAGGGGVLVLFTAYSILERVYGETKEQLAGNGFACYKQDDGSKTHVLNLFRKNTESVLFATDSFWEGVDVPGKALKMVIICKLPFAVPSNAIQKARAEAVERAGGNAFYSLSLPKAVLKLKQGFGRLMRHSNDYGAVVIADSRMVQKNYGKLFWNSLPPARQYVDTSNSIIEEALLFFNRDWE